MLAKKIFLFLAAVSLQVGFVRAQSSETELLNHLMHFRSIAKNPDSDARVNFAKKLRDAIAQNKQSDLSPHLIYFDAYAAFRSGDLDTANKLAMGIANDPRNVNGPDAVWLLALIGSERGYADTPVSNSADRALEMCEKIASFYPSGRWADSVMRRRANQVAWLTAKTTGIPFDPIAGPPLPTDDLGVKIAGDLYVEMKMYPEAINLYRRALGFLSAGFWISERTKSLWLGMGDSYAALSEWDQAVACYVKALASGATRKEYQKRIATVRDRIRQEKLKGHDDRKPDVMKLQKIAEICCNTMLFDDALTAIKLSEVDGPSSLSPYIEEVNKRKLEVLKKLLLIYGPVGNFRGTPLELKADE